MKLLYFFISRRYQLPKERIAKKRRPGVRILGLLGTAVIMIGFLGLLPLTAVGADKESAPKVEACAECHDDVATAFKGSFHGGVKASCTDCHGDAAKHLESGEAGTIFAFKASDTALQKSSHCLTCHNSNQGQYLSGAHAKAAMDCTQCHSIHKETYSLAKMKTKLCTGCHQDVAAEFQLNERHRLYEGILECTSCHDVHGPAIRERLGGFKQEACFKCHTDKSGPFIYEHGASRIEGCAACHDVHGSPNRHMLKHQNAAELCFSCHAAAPQFHQRFTTSDANCASCHATIHGSNLSHIFLK
jgi:DmsE family decaheme c-type cytochrome